MEVPISDVTKSVSGVTFWEKAAKNFEFKNDRRRPASIISTKTRDPEMNSG